jgi:hypothetical protein
MKKLFLSFMLLVSAPVFASYHFQCYQIVGSRTADQMFLLIPNLADLTSGASFSLSTDETIIENFTYLHQSSNKFKKGSIKLLGSSGSLLKIDHKGNERFMQIKSKDKVTTDYQCFIESSI